MQFIGTVYNFRAVIPFIIVLFLLDFTLKAIGMWRAARMDRKGWFIILFIVNSIGIVPLIFLSSTRKRWQTLRDSEKAS